MELKNLSLFMLYKRYELREMRKKSYRVTEELIKEGTMLSSTTKDLRIRRTSTSTVLPLSEEIIAWGCVGNEKL